MKEIGFNKDWFFYREGDAPKKVTLPYDGMIHEKRDPECENGRNTGYFPGGLYIYEKHFIPEEAWKDKKILLKFGGVYQRSVVYLNGEKIHFEASGYKGFAVDLTDHLLSAKENVIRVEADNRGANSRWYSGAGIYRNVSLLVGDKAGLVRDNIRVQTLSYFPAKVRVIITSCQLNPLDGFGEYRISLWDNEKEIACAKGKDVTFDLDEVRLWDVTSPYLYNLKAELIKEGNVADKINFPVGICKLDWGRDGFFVNGKNVKLRGACVHHDNGILGAFEHRKSAERRVQILKKAGFNAIRSAHNPLSEEMLHACDKYGLFVMDEFSDMWYEHKNRYDYAEFFEDHYEADLRAMVEKDASHPSVIMYSIGNEVTETKEERGIIYTEKMTELCHDADATRPVTCGINMALNVMHFAGMGVYVPREDEPKREPEKKNPEALKILMEMAKKKPVAESASGDSGEDGRKALGITDEMGEKKDGHLVGSEFFNRMMVTMKEQQQEVVKQPIAKILSQDAYAVLDIAGYNYADNRYELDKEDYPDRISVGSETLTHKIGKNWKIIENCPNVIGDFMWTGWDYLGEAGVGAFVYDSVGDKNFAYPTLLAGSGTIDITGYCRPDVFLNQVAYGLENGPFLSVEPVNHGDEDHLISPWRYSDSIRSWNWEGYEGKKASLVIYGRGAYVEIYHNDIFLGKVDFTDYKAVFDTIYEPGTILVVSYDEAGEELGRDRLTSGGKETRLQVQLSEEELVADGEDILYVEIVLTDEEGNWKPAEEREVQIEVSENLSILAFGNADPFGIGNFDAHCQKTYYGRLQAVIRSKDRSGDGIIRVRSKDLTEEAVVRIK